ncbi:MAG: GntR family transcriptional regulator [Planctomycetaceae bacterium]|nr:GntR family transcriptional regulator [Planctomycetaceae bacterium]
MEKLDLVAETIAPPSDLLETPVAEVLSKVRLDDDGTLTQQVYRALRSLIVNLHLMPNQFLPEKDVAVSLGVSKTPVREAFIRLAEENLVDIVPKIGTYVSPIDLKRAFKGYFIRTSLESACAEQLARAGDPAAIAALREELAEQHRCVERGDNDAFYILDNEFHAVMFLVAGLPNAKRLVDSAKAEVDRIKGLKSIYRFCRPEAVLYEEHQDIVDAIVKRDPDRARREIHRHLSGMNDAIQAILQEEKLYGMFNRINQGGRVGR